MKQLVIIFLKIFFRNARAWFFVILLPTLLFTLAATLRLESIIRVNLPVPYRDFLLVGIISMSLMQTGVYTVAYLFIDYKRLQILRRLYITPLKPKDFLAAQIVSRFVIALLQVGVLVLVGWSVFGAGLKNLWTLPILAFLGSTLFLNFGVLIAAFAKDYEEAAPYTTIIGLPLVFLGDVFFPVQNLPRVLIQIANFLPLKPLSAIMRHFLLGLSDQDLLRDFLILTIWLMGLTFISTLAFRKKIYR